MVEKPFISVVIPTFNRARQVQAALTSVLAQTYRNFEVVVIDDGSTDETQTALNLLLASYANNGISIRSILQSNQGQSAARNRAVNEAAGEWIAFLDSDDVWYPEKLEKQIEALRKFSGKSWACITDGRVINNIGMDTTCFRRARSNYQDMFGLDVDATRGLATMRDPFWMSTLLVHAEVGNKLGWFASDLKYGEDHDFLFRLSLETPICYVNCQLCLIDQSKSPQGSNCRPWDDIEVRLLGWQSVLEKWLQLNGQLSPDLRKTVVHNLQCAHSASANWYLEHGQFEAARSSLRHALNYEVTAKLFTKWMMMRFVPALTRRLAPRMRVSD